MACHFSLIFEGTNISHLVNRKIIFKTPFLWDMLIPWRVDVGKQSIHGDSVDGNVWDMFETKPPFTFYIYIYIVKNLSTFCHDFAPELPTIGDAAGCIVVFAAQGRKRKTKRKIESLGDSASVKKNA